MLLICIFFKLKIIIKLIFRIFYEKPIFKSIEIKEYKNIENGLYDKFDKQIATYTACDFPNNKPIMVNTTKYNYILFFRNIMQLKLII